MIRHAVTLTDGQTLTMTPAELAENASRFLAALAQSAGVDLTTPANVASEKSESIPNFKMTGDRDFRIGETIVRLSRKRADLMHCLQRHHWEADHATIAEAVCDDDCKDSAYIRNLVSRTNRDLESHPNAPIVSSEGGIVRVE